MPGPVAAVPLGVAVAEIAAALFPALKCGGAIASASSRILLVIVFAYGRAAGKVWICADAVREIGDVADGAYIQILPRTLLREPPTIEIALTASLAGRRLLSLRAALPRPVFAAPAAPAGVGRRLQTRRLLWVFWSRASDPASVV